MYTINLNVNRIGDTGSREFAKALSGTQVHTLYLSYNKIGHGIKKLLMEQYPHINWEF
jgi:uncharacterized radical SAM superfamily Fe-S cluster-containing enzyme